MNNTKESEVMTTMNKRIQFKWVVVIMLALTVLVMVFSMMIKHGKAATGETWDLNNYVSHITLSTLEAPTQNILNGQGTTDIIADQEYMLHVIIEDSVTNPMTCITDTSSADYEYFLYQLPSGVTPIGINTTYYFDTEPDSNRFYHVDANGLVRIKCDGIFTFSLKVKFPTVDNSQSIDFGNGIEQVFNINPDNMSKSGLDYDGIAATANYDVSVEYKIFKYINGILISDYFGSAFNELLENQVITYSIYPSSDGKSKSSETAIETNIKLSANGEIMIPQSCRDEGLYVIEETVTSKIGDYINSFEKYIPAPLIGYQVTSKGVLSPGARAPQNIDIPPRTSGGDADLSIINKYKTYVIASIDYINSYYIKEGVKPLEEICKEHWSNFYLTRAAAQLFTWILVNGESQGITFQQYASFTGHYAGYSGVFTEKDLQDLNALIMYILENPSNIMDAYYHKQADNPSCIVLDYNYYKDDEMHLSTFYGDRMQHHTSVELRTSNVKVQLTSEVKGIIPDVLLDEEQTFSFKLERVASPNTGENIDIDRMIPFAPVTADNIISATNEHIPLSTIGNASGFFDMLTFSEAGTYYLKITQIIPEEKNIYSEDTSDTMPLRSWTYDETTYLIQIDVTKDQYENTNDFEANIVSITMMVENESKLVDHVTFTNYINDRIKITKTFDGSTWESWKKHHLSDSGIIEDIFFDLYLGAEHDGVITKVGHPIVENIKMNERGILIFPPQLVKNWYVLEERLVSERAQEIFGTPQPVYFYINDDPSKVNTDFDVFAYYTIINGSGHQFANLNDAAMYMGGQIFHIGIKNTQTGQEYDSFCANSGSTNFAGESTSFYTSNPCSGYMIDVGVDKFEDEMDMNRFLSAFNYVYDVTGKELGDETNEGSNRAITQALTWALLGTLDVTDPDFMKTEQSASSIRGLTVEEKHIVYEAYMFSANWSNLPNKGRGSGTITSVHFLVCDQHYDPNNPHNYRHCQPQIVPVYNGHFIPGNVYFNNNTKIRYSEITIKKQLTGAVPAGVINIPDSLKNLKFVFTATQVTDIGSDNRQTYGPENDKLYGKYFSKEVPYVDVVSNPNFTTTISIPEIKHGEIYMIKESLVNEPIGWFYDRTVYWMVVDVNNGIVTKTLYNADKEVIPSCKIVFANVIQPGNAFPSVGGIGVHRIYLVSGIVLFVLFLLYTTYSFRSRRYRYE